MVVHETNSTYDYQTHTAYPTVDYILQQSGENIIEITGSKLKAEAVIRQLTDEVKVALMKYHLRETFNKFEFLIATRQDYRNEWIKTIANIIYQEYNYLDKTREEIILKAIEGSYLLSIERLLYFKYNYHEGY